MRRPRVLEYGMAIFSAIAGFCSPGSEAKADTPTVPSIQKKSWLYSAGESDRKITLLGMDNYSGVKSPEEALEVIKDDKSPSVILEGEWKDRDLILLEDVLGQIYQRNRKLIAELEPNIFRLKIGRESCAVGNYAHDQERLDELLVKCGGGKKYSDINSNPSYGSMVEKSNGDLLDIPTSEEDYQRILEKVESSMRSKKKDGYDFIFLAAPERYITRAFSHEVGHIFMHEDPREYDISVEIRDHKTKGDSMREKDSIDYIASRQEQVRKWADEKEAELEEMIKFVVDRGHLDTNEVLEAAKSEGKDLDKYRKVAEGLESLGAEKLREYFKSIVDALMVKKYMAEELAEIIRDVITFNDAYVFSDTDVHQAKFENSATEAQIRISRYILEHSDDDAEKDRMRKEIEEFEKKLKDVPEKSKHQIVEDFLESFGKPSN